MSDSLTLINFLIILGYHGRDVKDFAQRIDEIFSLDSNDDLEMRQRARNSVVERLSDKKFNDDFLQVLS